MVKKKVYHNVENLLEDFTDEEKNLILGCYCINSDCVKRYRTNSPDGDYHWGRLLYNSRRNITNFIWCLMRPYILDRTRKLKIYTIENTWWARTTYAPHATFEQTMLILNTAQKYLEKVRNNPEEETTNNDTV